MLLEDVVGVKQPLYVMREITNADDLIKWAKSQGFKTVTPEFHLTLAYSKEKILWSKNMAEQDELVIKGGKRSVEVFGDAVVLRVEDKCFHERWDFFIDELGASYDFPEYKPHITINYNKNEINIKEIVPYNGILKFGPESFKKLDDDWKKKMKLKHIEESYEVIFL